MVKLCIFDLDGTVLDTVGSIAHFANESLMKNGIEPIPVGKYKYLAGNGIVSLVRGMLEYRGALSDETYEKVFYDYDTAYNAAPSYKSKIFDGLKEVLDELKRQGTLFAIVSNKPHNVACEVVRELYGEGYFETVVGQKPGGVLKPDPTEVLNVARLLGAKIEECAYIGDTSTDMITGKRAGMLTVGVLWGFRGKDELLQNGADVTVEKPSELLDVLGA